RTVSSETEVDEEIRYLISVLGNCPRHKPCKVCSRFRWQGIVMTSGQNCKECGTAIADSSPAALCGKCLFELGLDPARATPNADSAALAPEGAELRHNLPGAQPAEQPGYERPGT